jgi:hypothetical protein
MICAVLANGAGASAQVAGATANPSPFSRESIRRAIDASIEVAPPDQLADSRADWQRVRNIRPKSEIFLAVGSWSAKCTVLASDDKSLTVMKLNDKLPFVVTELLRELVSSDPQLLITLTTTGSRSDGSRKVKIGPEGIFIGDKKIAAMSDVIVRIDRADVREVRKRPQGRSVGRTIGGAFLGLALGSAVGSLIDQAAKNGPTCGGACWGSAEGRPRQLSRVVDGRAS